MAGKTHSPPSAQSASALVRGEKGSLGMVLVHTAFRTAIIAGGLALAGHDDPKKLPVHALGGALAIEAFLLLYALHGERGQ